MGPVLGLMDTEARSPAGRPRPPRGRELRGVPQPRPPQPSLPHTRRLRIQVSLAEPSGESPAAGPHWAALAACPTPSRHLVASHRVTLRPGALPAPSAAGQLLPAGGPVCPGPPACLAPLHPSLLHTFLDAAPRCSLRTPCSLGQAGSAAPPSTEAQLPGATLLASVAREWPSPLEHEGAGGVTGQVPAAGPPGTLGSGLEGGRFPGSPEGAQHPPVSGSTRLHAGQGGQAGPVPTRARSLGGDPHAGDGHRGDIQGAAASSLALQPLLGPAVPRPPP
ncbi:proline-rich protein 2-like [Vulpes lagopus]|uniref:proline-rich protein 2-like n=1 Tax=Vulpes lagopus TaxID=494514 RepID=UPI001BC8FE00|nr:proline-rich protein 2-like [Vulpes lagopus]